MLPRTVSGHLVSITLYQGYDEDKEYGDYYDYDYEDYDEEDYTENEEDYGKEVYLTHVIEQPIFRIPNLEYLHWNFVYLLDQQ